MSDERPITSPFPEEWFSLAFNGQGTIETIMGMGQGPQGPQEVVNLDRCNTRASLARAEDLGDYSVQQGQRQRRLALASRVECEIPFTPQTTTSLSLA